MDSHRAAYTHYDAKTYDCCTHRWKHLPFCYSRFLRNFYNLIGCIGLYILIMPVTLTVVYTIFHFALGTAKQIIVLDVLVFWSDWKQFAFVLSMFIGFAMKKEYDASNNIPSPAKLVNLLVLSNRSNDAQVQIHTKILESIYSLILVTFITVSPMVRQNILFPDNKLDIWGPITALLSSHFSPSTLLEDSEIKSMIHDQLYSPALNDARKHIDEKLKKDVINEVSALGIQCEKFISQQQKKMSRNLTILMKISMYLFFVVAGMKRFSIHLTEGDDVMAIILSMVIHFVIFLCFLLVVRYAEQIVCPYNNKYDLYDLCQISNEKFEELEKFKASLTVDDTPMQTETSIDIESDSDS